MQDTASNQGYASPHLSPAEAAQKLGVSAKALRVYERHGLVKPIRGANGYRAYGPVEMVRLHQVLALKGLGLPLAKIAGLLAGRLGSLDALLELQEHVLRREADRLAHALRLIQVARTRLAAGDALSIDELANLTKETSMTAKATPKELETIFKPLIERHFTESELTEIGTRKEQAANAPEIWQGLMAEASRLMAAGDTSSPAALDLGRRWKAMMDAFTGGNPAISGKIKAVWDDAFADPAAAPRLPASPEMFGFIRQVLENLRASERNPE